MELDTLITYVLLFVFFVIPALVKRLKGKQKKEARLKKKKTRLEEKEAPRKKKKPGILEKLSTAVQEFVRELERQALEAKEKAGTSGEEANAWDLLDDRDKSGAEEDGPEPPRPARTTAEVPKVQRSPAPLSQELERPFAASAKRDGAEDLGTTVRQQGRQALNAAGPIQEPPQVPGVRAAIPAHSLQQAVVWAEILGPPKGMAGQ